MSDHEEFAKAAAAQWNLLVWHAFKINDAEVADLAKTLATISKSSMPAVRQKILAVRAAGHAGLSRIEIVEQGQSAILALYGKRRGKDFEPQRVLSWRVSRSLADAVQCEDPSPDAEEALVTRLARVGGLKTSDDLWEFLLSEYADVSDEELANRMGVGNVKTKAKKTHAPKQ